MDRGLNNRQFSDEPEDHTTTSENVADSPVSDDDATVTYARSPKKSRRSLKKRVVTVPISGGDGGSRSKTEVYPPADSWAWRKYGQKPIKGSPYPRGYYRCSSSKGCPARKQVERSHQDPTVLLVTYSHDHNHPVPATNKHHHITAASATASVKTQADEVSVSPDRPEPEPHNDFPEFTSDFGWLSSDMCSAVIDCPALVGPTWSEAEAATMLPIGEEDESLFGDLGDLPEYSSVFRRNIEYDGIVA